MSTTDLRSEAPTRTPDRRVISEARAEEIADREVQRRLDSDPAYIGAEDAETQAMREDEIAEQVWREIERSYRIER